MISKQIVEGELVPCIFEYIYLARPDSVLNDISVYEFQLNLGRRLAKQIAAKGWDIDTVVPVPDGSRPAAIEIASALNLPYREGLVKNRYVGRTFIMPSQRMREISVRRKLNAMRSVFEGKKVRSLIFFLRLCVPVEAALLNLDFLASLGTAGGRFDCQRDHHDTDCEHV